MRPNLFSLATKELSQDSFITWLIQWASPDCEKYDCVLNRCARRFVTELLSLQVEPPAEITTIKAGRQWENIDIWAEINGSYLLIIEDKTETGEHSNQLLRYKKNAATWCKENGFSHLVCVYLKTASESLSFVKKVKKQGFSVFSRHAFLEILNQFPSQNHIFVDFKERLQTIEDEESRFLEKRIKEWDDADWRGFYQALEKFNAIEMWKYTHSRSGGFWYAILKWHEMKDCYPYIQIAQGPLRFKIGEVAEHQTEMRNHYYEIFMSGCVGREEIRKPGRFGTGKYMTIAVVDRHVWLGGDNDFVDVEKVVASLKEYEKLFCKIMKKFESAPYSP